MGELRVGTSGFSYPEWRATFYAGVAQKRWFDHYAARFDTVELNGTFYGTPRASTVDAWRAKAPPGFLYAVKFSRFGSHHKKLTGADQTIPYFLDRAERLGPHLGPILVQLPPGWGCDADRLDAFLAVAPRRHRWVVEARDPSWLCDAFYDVLRRHGAALCVHDLLPDHPRIVTSDLVYVRFHGEDYAGAYGPARLAPIAGWLAAERDAGRDVFAYFNNTKTVAALDDAATLRALIGAR